jgi:transglutaminase-like putative cysteine protease
MIAQPVRTLGSITQETLRLMQDLIDTWGKHPAFVQLARQVADLAKAKNPVDEAWAVWAWVRSNVTYRSDPVGTQWVQDPWETAVKSRAGNCANMAIVAGTMLQALGHPVKATAVRWTDRETFTHAVVVDQKISAVVDPVSPTFAWPPAGRQVLTLMGAS